MRTSCTRRIVFSAGHRVAGHESKCGNPHGHNYVAEITATAPHLDRIGRIIDFSVIKERVGKWIDENWDHAFLVFAEDLEMMDVMTGHRFRHFALPINPTAEGMAQYLLAEVCPVVLSDCRVCVERIRLWETENCYAEICQ
jgi:6-pyruvoyltetrahydropterin/6-carboxytetrahydropterin synthase